MLANEWVWSRSQTCKLLQVHDLNPEHMNRTCGTSFQCQLSAEVEIHIKAGINSLKDISREGISIAA